MTRGRIWAIPLLVVLLVGATMIAVQADDDEGLPPLDDVKALLERAEKNAQAGEFDAVVKDCTRVIELEPENALAYRWRGASRASRREFREAIPLPSHGRRLPAYTPADPRERRGLLLMM